MKQTFNILIARMSYGWQESPDVADWVLSSMLAANKDQRIGRCITKAFNNTPTTLTRHEAVLHARRPDVDADFLWMIDADMHPDHMLCIDPTAATVTWGAFMDFAYGHYPKGPFAIAAPYAGRAHNAYSLNENIYVFRWRGTETGSPDPRFRLDQFSREEAAERAGIERVAALPTGLILYDMRCFGDLPGEKYRKHWAPAGPNLPVRGREWQPQEPPWFYYQYEDKYELRKIGTEDVTNTRDLSAMGIPQYCHWGTWAGHYKVKCVSKPVIVTSDYAGERLKRAALTTRASNERLVMIGDSDGRPPATSRAPREAPAAAHESDRRPDLADDPPEVQDPAHCRIDRSPVRGIRRGGETAPQGFRALRPRGAEGREQGEPPADEAAGDALPAAGAGHEDASGWDGGFQSAK